MNKLYSVTFAAALAAAVSAQSLENGYQSALRALPAGASPVTVVQGGAIVYFDGTRLVLEDGRTTRTLLSFGGPVFGSFAVQVTPTALLFGESSSGGVWLVPFAGTGQPLRLASINFNFAAAAYDSTHALVSARTGGFGASDNDILALDLQTGQVDPIALVPGASGPLVLDAAGDLYYATSSTSFPPPPGSVAIVRFPAGKIAGAFGPTTLSLADAVTVYSGLDAAGSIALDEDDDMFVVDWFNGQVLELSGLGGLPRPGLLADYANTAVSPGAVQFVGVPFGPAAARFEPYQPLLGGSLMIHESDFGSVSQARFVLPARPITTVSPAPAPPGPFSVVTIGGPPAGIGALALAAGSAMGPELAFPMPGFEQTLFWGLSLGAPTVVLSTPFDGQGRVSVPLVNPGVGQLLPLAAQVLFVDPTLSIVGSAAPVAFALQ